MAARKGQGKASLPVAGRTFYIDELEISKGKLKRLEKSLNLLGAKLEKFFTKDIFCLITDHAQPADYKTPSHSADGVLASTPSPFAPTPGSSVGAVSEALSGKAAHSRGALMLTRSHEQSNRHCSVGGGSVSEQLVRNAKQWRIKIIKTDVALNWMEKKILSLGLNKRRKKSSDRGERPPRHGGKVLKTPFVKIEDKSQSYRPIYRQFSLDAVPVFNTDAEFCPFETRGFTTALPKAGASQELSGNANTTLNTSKIEGNGDKGKHEGKEKSANITAKQPKGVQKKLTFCMVCKVRFDDLEQHLRSDQHTQYAEDDSNYEEVDKLVNNNACMERFLADIIKYHPVHQKEGLAQQHKMVDSATTTASLVPASTSAVPDVLETPDIDPSNVIHRSVSDSEGSLILLPSVEDDAGLSNCVVQCPPLTNTEASISSGANVTKVSDIPNISKVIVNAKPDQRSQASSVLNSSVDFERMSLAESHISPSEVVKLRKRGLTKQTCVKKSPKKKSPGKLLKKTKSQRKNSSNMADIEANWALLRDRKRDANTSISVLPMDVSYAALDESQLEVMARQRANLSAIEVDDKSLVQSIHSLLHDVALGGLSEEGVSMDMDDPLLSCDSYINHKLSTAKQNSMLKPTTPKKSPRVCLGARDLPDEHFSPQKQRMSLSIEKERRFSESQVSQRKKVSKFDIDKPISEPSALTENKENISNASSSYDALEISRIDESTSHAEAGTSTADASTQNNKRNYSSPSIPISNITAPQQCIPTPAQHNPISTQVVSSTPLSKNFKKSLFNGPQLPESAPKITSQTPRRKRKPSLNFKYRDEQPMEYSDCFGFDEEKTKERTRTDNCSKSVSPSRRTKFDYERQNSLLSFGSVSLSQYDDVFSEMPEMPAPVQSQSSTKKYSTQHKISTGPVHSADKKNHYLGFSDEDLQPTGFQVSASAKKKWNSETSPREMMAKQHRQSSLDHDGTKNANNKRIFPSSRKRQTKKTRLENTRKTKVTSRTAATAIRRNTKSDPSKENEVVSEQRLGQYNDVLHVVTRHKPVDIQEEASVDRPASPTPSYRSLSDSTRDSIIRYKYDYAISPNPSTSLPKSRRKTRRTYT